MTRYNSAYAAIAAHIAGDRLQLERDALSHCSKTGIHSYNKSICAGKVTFICKYCKLPQKAIKNAEARRNEDKKLRYAVMYDMGAAGLLALKGKK